MKRAGLSNSAAGDLFRVALVVLCFTTLGGCTSHKNLYYWGGSGGYESCLYSHYVKNEDENAFERLRKIITEAEKNNLRVAPGICAEYGFMLYTHGQPALAAQYFKKEATSYPESESLMKQLIARIENKQEEKGKEASAVRETTGAVDTTPTGGIQ